MSHCRLTASKDVPPTYLHGANIDDPLAMVRMENNKAVVYYYIKDHLGSVKALVDENGNPVQEYEYGAYGKTKVGRVTDSSPTNFVENRYAYTSREWEEETGDYYYRARYYDPSEGRFLSEDPIGVRGGDWNLYRYTMNDPMDKRDPSGNQEDAGHSPGGWLNPPLCRWHPEACGPKWPDTVCNILGGDCKKLPPEPNPTPPPSDPTKSPSTDPNSCEGGK